MERLKVLIILVVNIIVRMNCARILVYIPTPSISHQEPFRPLIQELAKGHEVTLITADPAFPKGKAPANLTEIDLHDISYQHVKKLSDTQSRGIQSQWVNQIQTCVFDFFRNLIDMQLQTDDVKNVIKDGKFDIIIVEAIARPLLGLSHVIKAPLILVSSLGPLFDNAATIGAPTHPLLYPQATRQKLNDLNFWEKVSELYNYYQILYIAYKNEKLDHEMLQYHFGKDIPTIDELRNNVDLLFLNVHPIFEGNHPVPPSVVYMWGIHKRPRKELPHDIKSFLDSSEHGVIYMSFGSNTNPALLPDEKIQIFVKVLCKLPYEVLWKWNEGELPGQCTNIRTAKWFPQTDILRHPNVKLFITQGGLQSTDEAISAGVPLLGVPMMGDQWYNVEKYVHFNIGKRLDFETLTEQQVEDSVKTIIEDESYRNNVKKLDALMNDEPMPASERAVWWVEHVLRHDGAKHLRAPAANISWAKYLALDLIFALIAILLTLLIGLISILYMLSYIYNSSIKMKTS